jgi:hypothetical protein
VRVEAEGREAKEVKAMCRKVLACGLALGLAVAVSAAVAEIVAETWYDVHQQYGGEAQPVDRDARQIEEIEVAPGVRVRADIWADDYVPTYEDLVRIGFLPEDAREFDTVTCTWGQLKVCLSRPQQDCDCKKNAG